MNLFYKKISIMGVIILSGILYSFDTNAIKVPVTQDLTPIGLNCSAVTKGEKGQTQWTGYECEIGTGFSAVTGIFQGLLKYITFIAALGTVLFIVINGILYSMAGLDEGLKSEAKNKIWMMIGGILLLLLSGVVLNIIAPWVYK